MVVAEDRKGEAPGIVDAVAPGELLAEDLVLPGDADDDPDPSPEDPSPGEQPAALSLTYQHRARSHSRMRQMTAWMLRSASRIELIRPPG